MQQIKSKVIVEGPLKTNVQLDERSPGKFQTNPGHTIEEPSRGVQIKMLLLSGHLSSSHVKVCTWETWVRFPLGCHSHLFHLIPILSNKRPEI